MGNNKSPKAKNSSAEFSLAYTKFGYPNFGEGIDSIEFLVREKIFFFHKLTHIYTMSENRSKTPSKNFNPPSGTTKVDCRDLTDWINKAWFPQLIENSFCLIGEEPDGITVGKIEAILQKVRSYQLFGKSTNWKLQS